MSKTNVLVLSGNICRDAELTETKSGTKILRARVASSTGYGDNEKSLFLGVTLFGKRAEALAPLLTKGKGVTVVGPLEMDEYEKDGQKRVSFGIIANEIELHRSKSDGEAGGETAKAAGKAKAAAQTPF